MLKVLIFGTGVNMQRIINSINYKEVEIISYVDNNPYKIGLKINNINVISSDEINQYKYDFIIIASIDYENITNQLIQIGVEVRKIVQFYNYSFFLPNLFVFKESIIEDDSLSIMFSDLYCVRCVAPFSSVIYS